MAIEAADRTQIIAPMIRAVPGFSGREAELSAIDAALWQKGGRAALTAELGPAPGSDAAADAARTLGGVGRSVIAQEYAWRNRDRYAGVWWVHGQTRVTLLNGIVDLGARLMPGLDDVPDRTGAAAATLDAIAQMSAGKPWLIVYDDVGNPDDIAHLMPAANAHTLITSSWADWRGAAQEIAIAVFPRPTAVEYLLERARQPDAHAAGRLADTLGCIPIALSHARATCWTMGLGYDAYRERLPDRIKRSPPGAAWPAAVFATVDLALEAAVARCPQAENLLCIAAYLAPDRIPLDIVTTDVMSEIERGEALAALGEVSLAIPETLDDGTPAMSVHRLVQEVMKARLTADGGGVSDHAHDDIALATRLMARAYPSDEPGPDDVSPWRRRRVLEPHVEALLAVARSEGEHAASTGLLHKHYAVHLGERVEFASAEPHLRRALEIDERIHGTDDPVIAAHLGKLADLLQVTNRLPEAEQVVRRALSLVEPHLGPEHPEVAANLIKLGEIMHRTNRFAEAEPLMRRALAIDQHAHGADHRTVARDLDNLARLLQATNRLGEAEPLFLRALAIDEKAYGEHHPTVGIRLNNLAGLFLETDRFGEAEPLMRRAVSIFENSLGKSHPDTGTSLNNLAELLRITNRPAEAEPLMRRVLEINEKTYGPEHPALAYDLNNLASLLQNSSHAADAEPLMRRAMHIIEASLGPDHPDARKFRANHEAIMEVVKALQDRLDADEAKRVGKYKAAHASPYPVTHIPVPEASVEERRRGLLSRMFGRR